MPGSGAPAGSATFRTNSTATIPKVTYVPVKPPEDEKSKTALANSGGAMRKSAFIRSLNLQPGEVDAVTASLASSGSGKQAPTAVPKLAKSFESSPSRAALPSPAEFANVPDADLLAFGDALVGVRQQAVTAAQASAEQPAERPIAGPPADAKISASAPAPAIAATVPEALVVATAKANSDRYAIALRQANTAMRARETLSTGSSSATSPIGMLNLERIEMTPAGIERGGLIATVPLAPKERTTVVQQEWSVISQDFTSIVTDSLANYSATGVTDATQLAQSTASQVAHANQFNVSASASGSCGFVTASVATSFGSQAQDFAVCQRFESAFSTDHEDGLVAVDPIAQNDDFDVRHFWKLERHYADA